MQRERIIIIMRRRRTTNDDDDNGPADIYTYNNALELFAIHNVPPVLSMDIKAKAKAQKICIHALAHIFMHEL